MFNTVWTLPGAKDLNLNKSLFWLFKSGTSTGRRQMKDNYQKSDHKTGY